MRGYSSAQGSAFSLHRQPGGSRKFPFILRGEAAKPGQFLDDTLPEITTSAEKYTIHSYDYVNDRVRWDRMDTPELMIDLYYDSGYKLSKETVEKIQLRGLECTYEKCEWLRKDDLEEDGVRGVRIYLKFPAFSTPGESAKAKQEVIEAEAAELEKKSERKQNVCAILLSQADGIRMRMAGGTLRMTASGIRTNGNRPMAAGVIWMPTVMQRPAGLRSVGSGTAQTRTARSMSTQSLRTGIM